VAKNYRKLGQTTALAHPRVSGRQPRWKPRLAKKRWTIEENELLTALYVEGLALRAIGLRLGVDKDAVLRQVRRLGLPKRQVRGPRGE